VSSFEDSVQKEGLIIEELTNIVRLKCNYNNKLCRSNSNIRFDKDINEEKESPYFDFYKSIFTVILLSVFETRENMDLTLRRIVVG